MKHYLCLIVCCAVLFAQEKPKTLAEALGYDSDAKIVILNADDYGMCHAENLGTQKVLEAGIVSSTTMMMPCPWVLEAVEYIKKTI
ncbi:Chitooligosaccharide deacetylase [Candidatus Uabimicrobium amorphum]|uniref:Chitooligosaccharide deacetylase n=1 Tax=Uabimicrobium amorphum TaxID=2596890 RepID=A0A5S9ITE9_UABAM|nr:ChbG/HpnK family deacetylase [Candidatus Uabimicrobium amorphum]BBM87417.1 Chitooligosaccharide deacetylase [Candidatus Uabimicrobium amorphum]